MEQYCRTCENEYDALMDAKANYSISLDASEQSEKIYYETKIDIDVKYMYEDNPSFALRRTIHQYLSTQCFKLARYVTENNLKIAFIEESNAKKELVCATHNMTTCILKNYKTNMLTDFKDINTHSLICERLRSENLDFSWKFEGIIISDKTQHIYPPSLHFVKKS